MVKYILKKPKAAHFVDELHDNESLVSISKTVGRVPPTFDHETPPSVDLIVRAVTDSDPDPESVRAMHTLDEPQDNPKIGVVMPEDLALQVMPPFMERTIEPESPTATHVRVLVHRTTLRFEVVGEERSVHVAPLSVEDAIVPDDPTTTQFEGVGHETELRSEDDTRARVIHVAAALEVVATEPSVPTITQFVELAQSAAIGVPGTYTVTCPPAAPDEANVESVLSLK